MVVVHAEEGGADVEVANAGPSLDQKVGSHHPLELAVFEDVYAGEIGAVDGEVEAGLRAADVEPYAAARGDHASPDVAGKGRGCGARVVEIGVGELRLFNGVAVAEEGDVAAQGSPLHTAGDVRDEKFIRGIADGGGEVGCAELKLAAYAGGELLGGRGGCVARQGSQDRDYAGCALKGRGVDGAGVQEDRPRDHGGANRFAEDGGSFEGRFEVGKAVEADGPAAVAGAAGAADPAAVGCL